MTFADPLLSLTGVVRWEVTCSQVASPRQAGRASWPTLQ